MIKSCHHCQTPFEITEDDLKFYDKISPIFSDKKYLIPPPTWCPECRMQRRLCFRNERSLYERSCSLCKNTIISNYSPQFPGPVYCLRCWLSDNWNQFLYYKDYDNTIAFFSQLNELSLQTPQLALFISPDAKENNCLYVNFAGYNKSCYLIFDSDYNEDCFYGEAIDHSKNCIDSLYVSYGQLCYENIDSKNNYNLLYSQNCHNCRDSYFLKNCTGCTDCFLCFNLSHKQFCINNKQLTKEDYKKTLSTFALGDYSFIQKQKNMMKEFERDQIQKHAHIVQSDNCSGDYIQQTKNGKYCFNIGKSEDVTYCDSLYAAKDCMDVSSFAEIEKAYESVTIGHRVYNLVCNSNCVINCHNLFYCMNMHQSSDCFGCVGLKNVKYCILNKQYTKEEYEQLVPKIIEKMIADGEWGEFFDPKLSPFGYNETVAMEYFPLTKEEALQKGFNWSDYQPPAPQATKVITADMMKRLPDNIKDIPDDILNWALTCEVSGKLYKIIKQELQFYREHNIPIPRRHPDQRHKDRMALRNPRKLWQRNCMKCNAEIQTTYSPDRPEIVYCEECYLKEVY